MPEKTIEPGLKTLTATEQLVLLRDMTERLGVVHEAQALQLRLCPYAVDPSLESSVAEVNLDEKKVFFRWGSPQRGVTSQGFDAAYKKRLKALDQHIRFMFGESWTVVVTMNGSSIFPLKSNVRAKPKKPAKRSPPGTKRAGTRKRR